MTALVCSIPLVSALFAACAPAPPFATGYVEGEYVLIAPVAAAEITALSVARGDRIAKDQPLADMERRDAEIALAEAKAAEARAASQLANLLEGRRPEEIGVIEATLASARAQEREAQRTADRMLQLSTRGAATETQRDDAATALEVARARVAEGVASLAVARLPARPGEIAAARAALEGARAALARAEWELDKRRLLSPADGTVADIIRHPGELAGPTQPVLSVLPDGAVKLRLYVPQASVAAIARGSRLKVSCDGCPESLTARVSYVADSPEFTPPVIYSIENRQKLVFLVEARPDDGADALKPGQIVDVRLPEAGR